MTAQGLQLLFCAKISSMLLQTCSKGRSGGPGRTVGHHANNGDVARNVLNVLGCSTGSRVVNIAAGETFIVGQGEKIPLSEVSHIRNSF